MKLTDIMFSVHDYDQDGDVHTAGIFLHFGETRVKIADDLEGLKAAAERIAGMVDEIAENYANKGV